MLGSLESRMEMSTALFDYRQTTGSADDISQMMQNDLYRWARSATVGSRATLRSDVFHPHSPLGQIIREVDMRGTKRTLSLERSIAAGVFRVVIRSI